MIRNFRVPHATLDSLATGLAHSADLDLLHRAHLSRNVLLISRLVDTQSRRHGFDADLRRGFELLCAAQASDHAAFAAVVATPQVGVWAGRCLRAAAQGAVLSWKDLGYLNSVAASAAIRCRLTCLLRVPVRRGGVMLPTLGMVMLPADDDRAGLRMTGQEIAVTSGGASACLSLPGSADGPLLAPPGTWLPMRRLTTSDTCSSAAIFIDDVDPMRDYGGIRLAGRLTETEFATWSAVFAEAWNVLEEAQCGYANAIATGLASIVPLRSGGSHRSATNPDAFGAAALTFTADPVEFAVSLIHEYQHSKLAALLHLLPLHRAGPQVRFSVPWRSDPRPLDALLHGAYAFLATTDFWFAQSHGRRDTRAGRADHEFAVGRRWVGEALGSLTTSGHLTDAGHRFVNGMVTAFSRWGPHDRLPMPANLSHDFMAAHWTPGRRFHRRSPDASPLMPTIELPVDAMLAAAHLVDRSHGTGRNGPAEPDERKWAQQ